MPCLEGSLAHPLRSLRLTEPQICAAPQLPGARPAAGMTILSESRLSSPSTQMGLRGRRRLLWSRRLSGKSQHVGEICLPCRGCGAGSRATHLAGFCSGCSRATVRCWHLAVLPGHSERRQGLLLLRGEPSPPGSGAAAGSHVKVCAARGSLSWPFWDNTTPKRDRHCLCGHFKIRIDSNFWSTTPLSY